MRDQKGGIMDDCQLRAIELEHEQRIRWNASNKTETFWTDAEIGIARDIARFRRLSVTYHTYYTK
jgi:ribonucleotide reductase beta subunit family protein with ferritin-like domain